MFKTLAFFAAVILTGCGSDSPNHGEKIGRAIPLVLGGMPDRVPPRRDSPEWAEWQRKYGDPPRPEQR